MHWLGQLCALHARLAEGLLRQVAARSLAWRGAPGGSSSGSHQCPAAARPCVRLLSCQVQPKLATKQAPRRAHHPPARFFFWHARSQGLRRLSGGSPLPRAAVTFALPAAGASSIGPRCRKAENELLRRLFPAQHREAPARQLLSEITLQATGSGFTAGGGGSLRAQKDAGGAPENEPADQRQENGKKPNKSQQLKKVFKEYGAVGVAFHVGISLMSLGMFYLAVSSGVDIAAILFKLGFDEALVQSKLAAGTSAFVLAYAIHKLFAPVRISITLVSVPLLVRYFRKIGFFKPPAPNP